MLAVCDQTGRREQEMLEGMPAQPGNRATAIHTICPKVNRRQQTQQADLVNTQSGNANAMQIAKIVSVETGPTLKDIR